MILGTNQQSQRSTQSSVWCDLKPGSLSSPFVKGLTTSLRACLTGRRETLVQLLGSQTSVRMQLNLWFLLISISLPKLLSKLLSKNSGITVLKTLPASDAKDCWSVFMTKWHAWKIWPLEEQLQKTKPLSILTLTSSGTAQSASCGKPTSFSSPWNEGAGWFSDAPCCLHPAQPRAIWGLTAVRSITALDGMWPQSPGKCSYNEPAKKNPSTSCRRWWMSATFSVQHSGAPSGAVRQLGRRWSLLKVAQTAKRRFPDPPLEPPRASLFICFVVVCLFGLSPLRADTQTRLMFLERFLFQVLVRLI